MFKGYSKVPSLLSTFLFCIIIEHFLRSAFEYKLQDFSLIYCLNILHFPIHTERPGLVTLQRAVHFILLHKLAFILFYFFYLFIFLTVAL